MLQQECSQIQPIDPAGGSRYVEALTDDLARKAWEVFRVTKNMRGDVQSAAECISPTPS
ncbi:MAG TPA: methylmalonyl-CoA mutase family protein [Negativicutes bacterium]|nr:methylmalonyl-CoA mutase family protein [Negativicutes bacterium]